MSDDLQRALVPRYQSHPWRRRKRSVVGKEWQPPTLQDRQAGVWCPLCRVRHPYNGKHKLLSQYEKRGLAWVIMWLCPATGTVIGELCMGEPSGTATT